MRLDKSNARRRLQNQRKQYEKEIDLPASGSVRRKKQKHFGNRVLRVVRGERAGFNLAICAANQLVAVASNWNRDRATRRPANCLVKAGPFDNE